MNDGNSGTNGGPNGTTCLSPSFTINYCIAPPSTAYKRAFITSNTYAANLATVGSGTGSQAGIDGADKLCQASANNAGIGGTWRAWISDGTYSPVSPPPGKTFTQSSVPYVLMNNVASPLSRKIANNWAGLIGGGILINFDTNELGAVYSVQQRTWTNTNGSGTFSSTNHCTNWTQNTSGTGKVGKSDQTGNSWTSATNDNCNGSSYTSVYRLYCFEQ